MTQGQTLIRVIDYDSGVEQYISNQGSQHARKLPAAGRTKSRSSESGWYRAHCLSQAGCGLI
ncbi:MAG TPA: hypothetical protein VI359_08890, partial [Nitrospiraceae bacterium]